MESVVLQLGHVSLSSKPGTFLQYEPVMWVLCIVLNRNCWISGHMIGFRSPRQIVPSVLLSPDNWTSASWVSWRLFTAASLGSVCFLSRIPLYAFACIRVVSLAPCMSNSCGISRLSASGFYLFAPSLARRSLSSFPADLLWPLTHWKVVLADQSLRRWAAFLNSWEFRILIHPSSSQDFRLVVRPSMIYFESVTILSG